MSERERRLIDLGFELGPPPKPAASYRPLVLDGTVAYLSGALPFDDTGKLLHPGKLPTDVGLEEAKQAARRCAVNLLSVLKSELTSLERVERILRLGGYVSSAEGFTDQHLVINGASELFMHVFGDAGAHSRSAMGVSQLPLGACVEVDMIAKIRP